MDPIRGRVCCLPQAQRPLPVSLLSKRTTALYIIHECCMGSITFSWAQVPMGYRLRLRSSHDPAACRHTQPRLEPEKPTVARGWFLWLRSNSVGSLGKMPSEDDPPWESYDKMDVEDNDTVHALLPDPCCHLLAGCSSNLQGLDQACINHCRLQGPSWLMMEGHGAYRTFAAWCSRPCSRVSRDSLSSMEKAAD